MDGRSLGILLVEDNPADIELTKESMAQLKILSRATLYEVYDGEEALEFLHRTGRYEDAKRPDLILLDLNLPKKDGKEVLKEIKEDPQLKTIPVIVLTSSTADKDIQKAYELHANCYLHKPLGLKSFERIVALLEQFWFDAASLPP